MHQTEWRQSTAPLQITHARALQVPMPQIKQLCIDHYPSDRVATEHRTAFVQEVQVHAVQVFGGAQEGLLRQFGLLHGLHFITLSMTAADLMVAVWRVQKSCGRDHSRGLCLGTITLAT